MYRNSLDMAKAIADICYDKLAKDVIVLDLSQEQGMCECDYFVIADAPTRNQLNDIADSIDKELSAQGVEPRSVQGRNDNTWTLMDYGLVIVHLFISGERQFYNLEGLWKSAPLVYSPEPAQKLDD